MDNVLDRVNVCLKSTCQCVVAAGHPAGAA